MLFIKVVNDMRGVENRNKSNIRSFGIYEERRC
jgi:hypothetical protein